MAKPKVAFYWAASCGGCEEAIIDLNEDVLKVLEAIDIVFWPVAMDFKYKDVEAIADKEITVSFINGGVRLQEQKEYVCLLRKKSKILIAFGSCAHLGGIPGLANLWTKEEIFKQKYKEAPSLSNPEGTYPQESVEVGKEKLELPAFFDTLYPVDQIVEVDYYIPGCPPPPDLILQAVNAILEEKLPAKGSVLAPAKALCDTCKRKDSKPEKTSISEIKRVHEVIMDPEKCFLDQGVICLGPATRSGCGERCINANMPCRGCFGPPPKVSDQGAKMLSCLASLFGSSDEEEIKKLTKSIADPLGTFYRYSMASSLLRRKVMKGKN